MKIVSDCNYQLNIRGFNAFKIDGDANINLVYGRKHFYKICITSGKRIIYYADKKYHEDGSILFFGTPLVPYSWQTVSSDIEGYTILFSDEFFKLSDRQESLLNSSFFKIDGSPIVKISEDQRELLNDIFKKVITEQNSFYPHKEDLIRTYINLILHEALKMKPAKMHGDKVDASTRLSSTFLGLLDRQFANTKLGQPLKYKTPKDYANILAVHINYLNRAVKKATGKSTSAHIQERIVIEAKAILKHSDLNINEIAYMLGFEYPAYFNNFFKKHTGTSPKLFRE
nr:helix-turn-helix domain-containing protein [uncultured Carboxylicivirga sp.]